MSSENIRALLARCMARVAPHHLLAVVGVLIILVATAIYYLLLTEPPVHARATDVLPTKSGILLTRQQMAIAHIRVQPIQPQPLSENFTAPGEVQANSYTAGVVSSRVTASVVARSAQLGDSVKQGQTLLTLYSQAVTEAQSSYLLAKRSLERLTRIKDVIAAQQYDEATAKLQEAHGLLESYGLSHKEIAQLDAKGLGSDRTGQFVLAAPVSGTILEDNFKVGDVVEAGKPLFQIANLGDVWVEAHVSPAIAPKLTDDAARVIIGDTVRNARIIQRHETVDESTRTVDFRLKLDNADRFLRPGQYVDVEFEGTKQSVLSLPTEAVLRNSSGRWVVYEQQAGGAFVERPVTVLFTANRRTAIKGIAAGTPVATSGAFFIMSEAAKASFGEAE